MRNGRGKSEEEKTKSGIKKGKGKPSSAGSLSLSLEEEEEEEEEETVDKVRIYMHEVSLPGREKGEKGKKSCRLRPFFMTPPLLFPLSLSSPLARPILGQREEEDAAVDVYTCTNLASFSYHCPWRQERNTVYHSIFSSLSPIFAGGKIKNSTSLLVIMLRVCVPYVHGGGLSGRLSTYFSFT